MPGYNGGIGGDNESNSGNSVGGDSTNGFGGANGYGGGDGGSDINPAASGYTEMNALINLYQQEHPDWTADQIMNEVTRSQAKYDGKLMGWAYDLSDAINTGADHQLNALDDMQSLAGVQLPEILKTKLAAIDKASGISTQGVNDATGVMNNVYDSRSGYLDQASTAEGLDQQLQDIMSGKTFNGLMDERMRGSADMLSVGGLTRSGAALEEGARIPSELAFAIQEQLYGNNQDYLGRGLDQGQMNADGITSIADILSQSALTSGNESADSMTNQLNIGMDSISQAGNIKAGAAVDSASTLVEAALAKLQADTSKSNSKDDRTGDIVRTIASLVF